MPILAFLVVLAQDKTDTYGKTNAQILAMGRSRWVDFYTSESRAGQSTAGMAGAEGFYGEALAWRNDRLGKARIGRLRSLLQDTKNDAVGVGSAITGGGTMWNIIASGLYSDAEETLYAVLTKTGKAPRRKVSDVEKALVRLRTEFRKAQSEPEMMKMGRECLVRLRRDLDGVIVEATRQPRKGSDALLDFCVRAMDAGRQGG